jgi:AraC family transcriptional regulator
MVTRVSPGSYFGDSVRSGRVGGLFLAERTYAAGLDIPPHEHENGFFFLVLQGACTETQGRITRAMGPAALAFHPAGDVHADRWHGPGGRCFHIEITALWCERLRELSAAPPLPACFRDGLPAWLALRLYREFADMDAVSPLVIEGLALELVAEVARGPVAHGGLRIPGWLSGARELLAARFRDKLTLGDVARAADVHPVHLATSFRKHFGCTVGDYVRRRRVTYACRRLADSDLPLAEVALEAGFADQSHFSKTFRRLSGMTPAQYRKSFRR